MTERFVNWIGLPTYDDFNNLRTKFLEAPEQFLDDSNWIGTNVRFLSCPNWAI